MCGFIYGTDHFDYKPQYISSVRCIHNWVCVLHTKFVLHYQPAQQPDQAPAACLPKITCELVFLGTPAACCHSVHLPASWKGCHWLAATLLDGRYHPDPAIVRGWHSLPSPLPHTHPPLSPSPKTEKRPKLDTPLPKDAWPFTKKCYNCLPNPIVCNLKNYW